MLLPSTTLPPVVPNADPVKYHLLGSEHPRGDARRTMSRSELIEFGKCPRRWLLGAPKQTSDEMEWGSLMDCITLTPDRFATTYAVCPVSYPTDGKGGAATHKAWNWNATYCKEWRSAQLAEGRTCVKSEEATQAWKARDRIAQDEHIKAILNASQTQVQVNVEWHDEPTGLVVPVKCLLDIVPSSDSEFGDTLADLKTTRNAAYRAWVNEVFSYGYHIQAALYLDAMNAASGLRYRNFEHEIQESEPPYETTHRMLSAEFLILGREAYRGALERYCWSLKNDTFAGYDCALTEPLPWMLAA